MIVGIISDTHGNLGATRQTVRLFTARGVEAIFHCGDIGSFDVLTELAVSKVPVHAVLGNVDVFSNDWKFFPTNLGFQLHGRFGTVELGGKRFALLHSDDKRKLHEVIRSQDYDFVLTGHTHECHDYMEGRTRCINPGAAGKGWEKTCAVLDLKSGDFELIQL